MKQSNTSDGSSLDGSRLRPPFPPVRETVALISGMDGAPNVWNDCLPLLRDHYQLLLFDKFSLSTKPTPEQEWNEWGADLASFLTASNTPLAHLVGFGTGAELAIRFSLLHPDKVASLVLISWDPIHDAIAGDRQSAFPVYRFKEVRHPVLILAGDADPTMPVAHHGPTLSFLPDCTLFTVPRSTRNVIAERPRLSARLILHFLSTLKDRTTRAIEHRNAPDAWKEQVLSAFRNAELRRGSKHELTVRVMDNFHVSIDGEPIREGLSQRNVKRLLLYLVFHRSPMREQICDELWPEASPDNARNLLRVSLSHLRKLLARYSDYPFLQTDRDSIRLCGAVRCDLLEYSDQMADTLSERDEERKCESIVRLLRQTPRTLLHGFYDEWVTHLKMKLENELLELIEWIDGFLEERGEWDRAIRVLETVVGLYPEEERFYDKAVDYYERLNRPKKEKGLGDPIKTLRCSP
ncbi:alpha/beta hydrolase [Cohnella sp. AR92]|uniref:alpha/beta hydrolase n=1 Tax=Cohnella sp. AR92 TaxID=648716 RepID=UPI000F8EE5EB|nr:alpha/beta hydrolase [Cohnella sp. AR92]RUS48511.1 alpha/beta hydrolase [Cohnella sp. AR92]